MARWPRASGARAVARAAAPRPLRSVRVGVVLSLSVA